MLKILISFLLLASQTLALELIMVEQAGCTYCGRFNATLAPIYPKTEVGQRAPFKRLDIGSEELKTLFLTKSVRYTPTFLLIENNKEIARQEGFISEDFFWGWIEKEVSQAR
jgi:thioredoxin-related protein